MTPAWGAVYAVAARAGVPWTRYTTRAAIEADGARELALVEKRMDEACIEATRRGVERGMALEDAERAAYEGKAPEAEGGVVLRYTSRSGRARVSATAVRAILSVRREGENGVPCAVAHVCVVFPDVGPPRVGPIVGTRRAEERHLRELREMVRAAVPGHVFEEEER